METEKKQSLTVENLVVHESVSQNTKEVVERLLIELFELHDFVREKVQVRLNRDMWWRSEGPTKDTKPRLFAAAVQYAMLLELRVEELSGVPINKLSYKVVGEYDTVGFDKRLNERLSKLEKFLETEVYKKLPNHQQSQLVWQQWAMRVISDHLLWLKDLICWFNVMQMRSAKKDYTFV